MKKLTIVLPVVLLIVASLSSCKLENFDKWLTDGEWVLSSANFSLVEIEDYNAVNPAITDLKNTLEFKSEISSGNFTQIEYSEKRPSVGSITFDRTTTKGTYTQKITFNEDGTYTMTTTRDDESTQVDDETGNGPVVNISQEPATTTSTGFWNWVDDTDKKSSLDIENIGMVEIEIEKEALTLTYKSTSASNSKQILAGEEIIVNTSNTTNNTWSFTK